MDSTERDRIIASFPSNVWRLEGVAYCAFDQPGQGRTPLYRFWSSTNRSHFFTTDAQEKQAVIDDYPDDVWRFEGVAYYVE